MLNLVSLELRPNVFLGSLAKAALPFLVRPVIGDSTRRCLPIATVCEPVSLACSPFSKSDEGKCQRRGRNELNRNQLFFLPISQGTLKGNEGDLMKKELILFCYQTW